MEFAIDCPQRTHSLVVSGATFLIGDIGGAVGVRTFARESKNAACESVRGDAGTDGSAAARRGKRSYRGMT